MALTASIIIPTNRTELIDETILSIARQTRRPKEVILVYDAYGFEGAAKLNRAVSMITADTYLLLGDDDKLDSQYLEKTLNLMESENTDVVATDLQEFGDRNGVHKPGSLLNPDRMHEVFGLFYTTLVRKTLWEKVGGYDPKVSPFDDWDFWWMCAEAGAKVSYLPEPLFLYRTHAKQDSVRLPKDLCDWSRQYILNKHERLKNKPPRHQD